MPSLARENTDALIHSARQTTGTRAGAAYSTAMRALGARCAMQGYVIFRTLIFWHLQNPDRISLTNDRSDHAPMDVGDPVDYITLHQGESKAFYLPCFTTLLRTRGMRKSSLLPLLTRRTIPDHTIIRGNRMHHMPPAVIPSRFHIPIPISYSRDHSRNLSIASATPAGNTQHVCFTSAVAGRKCTALYLIPAQRS